MRWQMISESVRVAISNTHQQRHMPGWVAGWYENRQCTVTRAHTRCPISFSASHEPSPTRLWYFTVPPQRVALLSEEGLAATSAGLDGLPTAAPGEQEVRGGAHALTSFVWCFVLCVGVHAWLRSFAWHL